MDRRLAVPTLQSLGCHDKSPREAVFSLFPPLFSIENSKPPRCTRCSLRYPDKPTNQTSQIGEECILGRSMQRNLIKI